MKRNEHINALKTLFFAMYGTSPTHEDIVWLWYGLFWKGK